MPAALRGLFANLAAGVRVALFLPVERPRFRIGAAQLLLLAIVSALVDLAADWAHTDAGATLDWAAVGAELASLALLIVIAALLAWAFSDAPLLVGLPVIVLASLPIVQIVNVAPSIAAAFEAHAVAESLYYAILLWFFAVLTRSAYVAMEPHRFRFARSLAAGLLLTLPLTLPPDVLPNAAWFRQAANPLDPSSPVAEPVVALQRELQASALAALEDHRRGETDLYFVAFAPDGMANVWRTRVEQARRVMDRHWSTEGRSLAYVNDAMLLTEAPMATVTHLREALEEIAGAIEPDEDVLMLYLAGRGNPDGSLVVALPPLGLVQLSATGLSHLLRQAGIRFRVIVVASCLAQPFVDALADANTMLMTAGCPRGGEPTALADALFGEALPTAASLAAAFKSAQRQLDERGLAPVLHVGEAIEARLSKLKRGVDQRAGLVMLAGILER